MGLLSLSSLELHVTFFLSKFGLSCDFLNVQAFGFFLTALVFLGRIGGILLLKEAPAFLSISLSLNCS